MIKAVNIRGYEFSINGRTKFTYAQGFAMLDTETNTFVSTDGKYPMVLERKKFTQSCIDAGWPADMQRVAFI